MTHHASHPPSVWLLAWRNLWRDLRAGDLRLLTLAVTLAVAALTAVGFFADRLQGGLERDARQLLGGDLVVVSDLTPPPQFTREAARLGLQAVTTFSFPTMARAPDGRGGASRLVLLKAVAPGYPLRGQLGVAPSADGPARPARAIPAPGQAWAEPALFDALGLHPGDSLLLGDSRVQLTQMLLKEPDRGAGFANFAPRVLLNEADLPATGLIQPASRLTYRLALAGDDAAVRQFRTWAEAEVARPGVRGVRIESLESGRPEMRQTLDRAEKFLHLVALLAALLSAVAVALAARAFAARHLDDCAMLRVLGQSQQRLALGYALEFAGVGVAASGAGVLLGWAIHHLFVWLLAGLIDGDLPPPSLWPVALGLGMGLTLLAAFGLPPVLQLAQVPPLRVLRRELGQIKPASAGVLGLGVLGFAALLLAASRDLKLGLIAVGGFAAAVLLFAALAWLAVKLLRASVREESAPGWLVLATRQVAARPAYTVIQVSALAVGLLALALLVLLRTDLISAWRQASPADAPNRFVINILPEQGAAFQERLRAAGVRRYDWYPMIRGRLIAINGRTITPADYREERAQRLVDREFNLSHSQEAPPHNPVVAGHWTPNEAGAISVESGIAETLGLKLGDSLRFDIAGTPVEARITSLRQVDWSSLHANFFVMYPLADMPELPATWLAAYRAPGTPGFDNALVKAFPNITNVDMGSTLNQVQQVLDQVIRAVEFLFGFTLAAGLTVLLAAVSATREERAREYAIMRAVGASARLLGQVQRAELIGVGALAGFLASSAATLVGWLLARQVFEFEWHAPLWVPLAGAVCGALLALAAGWWGLREVLQRPVMQTLRQAAS